MDRNELVNVIMDVSERVYNKFFKKIDTCGLKEDLLHEGVIGGLEVLDEYDQSKNILPKTFFYPYVLRKMVLLATSEIFHTTDYLQKKRQILKQKFGTNFVEQPIEDLMKTAKVSKNVAETLISSNNVMAYHKPLHIYEEVHHGIPDFKDSPEQVYLKKEHQREFNSKLQRIRTVLEKSNANVDFFFDKVGINNKAMTYRELEQKYCMTHKEAQAMYKRCCRCIQKSKVV